MRKHVPLILVLVSMAASVCFAYLALTTGPKRTGLVVDPPEYDFGKVKSGTFSHTFKVTNRSRCPVKIEGLLAGCSCASVRLPAKTLAPGESVSGSCEIDTRGRRGSFVSFLKILYTELGAEPKKQAVQCVLRANVETAIGIDPAEIVFDLGASETKQLRITSSRLDVKVCQVRTDHPAIQGKVAGDGLGLELTFDASLWKDREAKVMVDLDTTLGPEAFLRIPVYIVRSRTGQGDIR